MSENKALSELVNFIAKSPLASENDIERRSALNSLSDNLSPKPIHKKVSKLFETIIVLSARSKRIMLPQVKTEIDVFTPNSKRAVKILMAR